MHIYVHVPFCARRCAYCDFAIAVRREVPSRAFVEAVRVEWARWREEPVWDDVESLGTVYFGGGTPSRLAPDAIAELLALLTGVVPLAADAEVTLEANPEDVSPDAARAWAVAGVNRVSLGVQSFDPAVLRWMHRTHSAGDVPRAVAVLREAGIAALSLDLIYALPPALDRDWDADLDQALALAPDHLSLYGLTVEPGTPLGRWTARGDTVGPPDERYAAEFLRAHARLGAAGYEHYEVSNYARPGRRARHNGAYWRQVDYIGLGPSAHARAGGERRWNVREWEAYRRAAEAGATLVAGHERLDADADRLERLYLGLRTDAGVPSEALPAEVAARWVQQGWASAFGGRLRLTAEGWLRLDALVASVA
ncbi:MAG: radical SAM family heme chaperone HemW [Gemmatimonadales bacterium]|nr:radical SAM family heme chaperone HemW [Gemmatimonadales bacterium]